MLQKGKIKSTVGASKLSAPLCKSDPDLNIAPFRNVKSNQNVNRWIFSETNTHCAITRFSVSLTWGDMSEMANKWLLREGEALMIYFSIRWSERRNKFGAKKLLKYSGQTYQSYHQKHLDSSDSPEVRVRLNKLFVKYKNDKYVIDYRAILRVFLLVEMIQQKSIS